MNTALKTLRNVIVGLGLLLFVSQLVTAQSLPVPDVGNYGGMVQNPGDVTSFDSAFASLAVGLVLNVRYLLTAIAIALLVYAGYNMVIGQGKEENWTKAKSTMVWGIVGLALVGLSGEIVRIFAVGKCAELGMLPASNNVGCVEGGFLKDPQAIIQRSTLFNKAVQYIITFLKYLIGGVAVVMLTRNAIRMASNSAGDELEKDKKNLIASALGLIMIIVADPIINKVFFSIDKTRYPSVGGAEVGVDYAQGIGEIVGFTNFLVSILTPLAILVIVAGGVMYMTAGTNAESQEKAKRMITLALGALVLIYGAFAIVSTFISGQFDAAAPTVNPAAQVEQGSSAPNYDPNV
jgi:hypothetical protein